MEKKNDLIPARNMSVFALMAITQELVSDLFARIEKLEEHKRQINLTEVKNES